MVAVGGTVVGLEDAVVRLALPVVTALLWVLVVRESRAGQASEGQRRRLLASRLLIAGLLIVAAAGPYTVTARETTQDPNVVILADRSASTAVGPDVADRLEADVESLGVPVRTVEIASRERSRIGDAVVDQLAPGSTTVLVSDGRVTGGQSLAVAAETARRLNVSINAVAVPPDSSERLVSLHGPQKTSVGVENRYLVGVDGLDGSGATTVRVEVDGETVLTEPVEGRDAIEFTHAFEDTGEHRITAEIGADDVHDVNDVAYRSVRVVEPPSVLYVSERSYPLGGFLEELYAVTRARSVPGDLSTYHAVVVQDVPAAGVGDLDALERHVIDGGGLVVVGGPRAYDAGGYGESAIAPMLPVRAGEPDDRRARIVIVMDISQSAAEGISTQKALALDVLDQLGDQNLVGLVAFHSQAFRVADLRPLSSSRADLEDKVRRLVPGGSTMIAAGLDGAAEMLRASGTVILISDGVDAGSDFEAAATRLGRLGIPVIAIGVGARVNDRSLRRIAAASGGTYMRADESNRLRILFGDETRRFAGTTITVVDSTHFITAGVRTTTTLANANTVAVKDGADFLVATQAGQPAVSAWRYGLGRVVSVTAYGVDGGLDGLLAEPDSLLVSKSVNWAVGDPERTVEGATTDVPDTNVGEPTTAVHTGPERPSVPGVAFSASGSGAYRATIVPTETGFHRLLDAEYAVNYPLEYAAYGFDPALRDAVSTTGGRVFAPSDAPAIAALARERATRVRDVRTEWRWVLLAAALVAYLLEVALRRLRDYRPHTTTFNP